MPILTVIVPTLNEVENIDPLVTRILTACAQDDIEILFVDSASTDGTDRRILAWQDKAPVRLLQCGQKTGLADAVVAGAKRCDSPYTLVMDADLSHPPEALPAMLQILQSGGHDMVIGSRYVLGASVPDWPLSRKLCSRLATIPARLFCRVKDPLTGFFAVERRRLAELGDTIPGFKIGLAILAEYGKELRVAEIPIEFRDRDCGRSKMRFRIVVAYLHQLLYLAAKRAGAYSGMLPQRIR